MAYNHLPAQTELVDPLGSLKIASNSRKIDDFSVYSTGVGLEPDLFGTSKGLLAMGGLSNG